jgi:transposase
MKIDDSQDFALPDQAEVFVHDHLPLAAAYCRRLGLVETVDRLVPTRMEISPGLVVQAMVLDTLSGRSPLYRVAEFLESRDVELLLGQSRRPSDFNDTNLARSLDAMFDSGTGRILGELGLNAFRQFGLDGSRIRYDTTSVNVWGAYRACEQENPPPGPVIHHGHSKDKRPDLKQFMVELLCVDRNVPVIGRTLDGNSSDKTSNHDMLGRVSRRMADFGLRNGAFVYVADSAMVTGPNLDTAENILFVTRMPFNYEECNLAVERAVHSGEWTEIGPLAEKKGPGSRPVASYKAVETHVFIHGKIHRALVVHTSLLDKRRIKKLEKRLSESEKELTRRLKEIPLRYFCRADAEAAAANAEKMKSRLHRVKGSVAEVKVPTRGRPSLKEPRNTRTVFDISVAIEEIKENTEKEKLKAGCFVLLSNIPSHGDDGMDAKTLLETYKGQHAVEANFSFLKDPTIVNDIFLKTPSRIEVLGMILIISLMVWRLMEKELRRHVEQTDAPLPGWDKKMTTKPTAFMMTTKMIVITTILINGKRHLIKKPTAVQRQYLDALGLSADAYCDPASKCKPKIPPNTASKK